MTNPTETGRELTKLQIPIKKGLKTSAEQAAKEMGFSSLQEIIRVFVTGLAQKKYTGVSFSVNEPQQPSN